ncbi:MAG: regulatory protein RecX [Lachnospiraceae bacterium]
MQITEMEPQGKGKYRVRFENGVELFLYRGEIKKLQIQQGEDISDELFSHILYEVVGLRAKKRAMHLLEKMDRTEWQLREKLKATGYPQETIDLAVEYVKRYHYIDDERYACSYIRFRQEQKSRQRLKQELMQKGVDRDTIERALEETYESDETQMIQKWLVKKHYDPQAEQKERAKIYQFLLRKGFKSSDILRVMRQEETEL